MTQWDVITFGYAAFLAMGGVMGYVKKGSIPSLASGIAFGALAAYGGYLTSKNPDNFYLAAGVSVLVGGMMGYRFVSSGKVFPAGVACLMSLGMVARFGYRALGSK